MQFEDNGADIGSPVTLDGTGQATYTTSSSPGLHNIMAVYSGDTNFGTATAIASLPEFVARAPPTLRLPQVPTRPPRGRA